MVQMYSGERRCSVMLEKLKGQVVPVNKNDWGSMNLGKLWEGIDVL